MTQKILLMLALSSTLQAMAPDPLVWTTPSTSSAGSMPIGNGDIGLNVWAQADGTIRTYIAKTDAWDASGRLLRLGGVDIAFSPNPFAGGDFSQTLDAAAGQIVFKGGNGFEARLWVDANAPVIRVEASAPAGVSVSVKPNIWRREKREIPTDQLQGYTWYMGGGESMGGIYGGPEPVYSFPDVVTDLEGDRIGWYQRNESSFWEFGFRHQQMDGPPPGETDPLLHRTFGVVLSSPQLAKKGAELLESAAPVKDFRLDIVALTEITPTAEDWIKDAVALSGEASSADLAKARADHEAWWKNFWDRSYIRITKASEPPIDVASATSNPLSIGVDAQGLNGFVGTVARVRIFGHALSREEIAALDSPEPAKGLVADWDFSGFNGGSITDSVGGLVAEPFGNPQAATVDGKTGVRLAGTDGLRVPSDPKLDLTRGGTLEMLISADTQAPGGGRLLDKGQPGTEQGYVLDTFPGNSLRLITKAGALEGGPVLPVGGWHRVLALFGPDGRRISIDGKIVAEAAPAPPAAEPLASELNQAYQLQRYTAACAGRGAFPIRFNGSLFWGERQDVLGAPPIDPDWRMWAADYWWQNTRLPYYPMLASGDYDFMKPLFDMYFRRLPTETARTKAWFGCEGAFMAETASFWGMMSNGDYGYERPPELEVGELKNGVMRYYWQPGIELTHMMLDYYDHTGDEAFVKERLAPMAEAYLKYYATRFGRDGNGKLVITPAQSLETWANVVNPTPDVAGLAQNTKRILALPENLVPESLRKLAKEMLDATPEIPMRTENGREIIGFAEEVNSQRSNFENPELYPVYPYRNYGIGRPGLDLARETYAARITKDHFGWHQSGMQAACLGMADECAIILRANLGNKNANFRFPTMWGPNYDWVPDQDHGSNLVNTLQLMLLQPDGDKILLAPAWPEGWEADFKLHAPKNTTVEASIRKGKIENLKVTPPERAKDVVDCLKKKVTP
ncbi:MAG: LamG domain-containing protein [Chthoniobacterales bacterium]|nr:LamG domain-containing protein [Chthoniobacterales bacterium]